MISNNQNYYNLNEKVINYNYNQNNDIKRSQINIKEEVKLDNNFIKPQSFNYKNENISEINNKNIINEIEKEDSIQKDKESNILELKKLVQTLKSKLKEEKDYIKYSKTLNGYNSNCPVHRFLTQNDNYKELPPPYIMQLENLNKQL